MTYILTPKGREALILGSSTVLAAIEDGLELSELPFTPKEIEQTLKDLTDLEVIEEVE